LIVDRASPVIFETTAAASTSRPHLRRPDADLAVEP
jgi:hypothetical protein